jgi:serine phosphatase RsbU (regulator of sigma subunit)
MKQLYFLLFLISALCKLSSAQQTNQAYIDSVLNTKFIDIEGRVYDWSDYGKKILKFKVEITNEDSTFYFISDSTSNKFKLTLNLGKSYTLSFISNIYEIKRININTKDSIDIKEMSFINKRKTRYYYPIAITLFPSAILLTSQKELFRKANNYVGKLIYDNKIHDFNDDSKYAKERMKQLFNMKNQLEIASKNPEFINEINKIQDSLNSAKKEILVKSNTIKERESQLEAEKFTRLEIEKKSLEDRLIFEKQAQQKQYELLQKEAALQKTSLQNLLNQKNIVSLSQANEIQKLDAAQKQTAIAQLQQQEQYNQTRINLLNVEKREKQKETELKDAEIKSQRTTRLFLLAGLFAALLLLFFIFRSYRIKQKANHIITLQKEEVEKQRNIVINQKEEVEKQRNIVVHQNREILDSIEYAKRIQATILPPPKVVKKYLEDSFILYIPKDIVAGDFYWMDSVELENKDSEYILFAACDCTGHGVPGALVSVVCSNALNRAVREYNIIQPSLILDKVSELEVQDFSKDENEEVQDGMDASLCSLNVKTGKLEWAGANNPLWVVRRSLRGVPSAIGTTKQSQSSEEIASGFTSLRNDELNEVKPDKQPIGKFDNKKPFTNHSIQLQKGDTIYMFTDGYADQFGGEKGKKYSKKAFRELVISIAHLPLQQQREALYNAHLQWRGNNEQVDDICIIGVRV